MHKKIKERTRQKTCFSTDCIKSPKKGTITIEKEKILQRWTEYIRELFHDNRREKPKNVEKLILKHKIGSSQDEEKAAGPDEIVIEMLSALNDFGD